ncbi:MAG: PepSY domain-containing protein [Bradyrhizobium sp.]
MNKLILVVGAAAVVGTGAVAQTTTHTATSHRAAAVSSHNSAVKDSDPAVTAKGADGANSFTEDQARSRLADAGYTNVTKLAKDKKGVWRGTASKGGTQATVGLDYKGNIVTR